MNEILVSNPRGEYCPSSDGFDTTTHLERRLSETAFALTEDHDLPTQRGVASHTGLPYADLFYQPFTVTISCQKEGQEKLQDQSEKAFTKLSIEPILSLIYVYGIFMWLHDRRLSGERYERKMEQLTPAKILRKFERLTHAHHQYKMSALTRHFHKI